MPILGSRARNSERGDAAYLLGGPIVIPFCGLCLGSYTVIPRRNYNGAYGDLLPGPILMLWGI